MLPRMLYSTRSSLLGLFVAISILLFNIALGITVAQAQSSVAQMFSLPLGYRDGVSYGPRINYMNGQLIEDSEYGVRNPDMQGNTCFGVDWGQIYHAGEDWYREDGQSTWQAEVTAVADGIVKYLNFTYPGAAIIIEHGLPPNGQQKIYSLYGHLDTNSVIVSANQNVLRGQKLGTVMQQYFDGRYTNYHDDSHLHFEMRYFYDASNVYINYPSCNGYLPGRGYTYPALPDNFPTSGAGYTDPVTFVLGRGGLMMPLILKQSSPTPTRTATVTQTPTRTNTPVFTPTPTRTPTPTPVTAGCEPNNSLAQSCTIFINQWTQYYIWPQNDVDWYSFTVNIPMNEAREVDIYLESIPTTENYNVQLYDASNNVLNGSSNSGNTNEHINYYLGEPSMSGTYYVRVYPASSSDYHQLDSYALKVQITVTSPYVAYPPPTP